MKILSTLNKLSLAAIFGGTLLGACSKKRGDESFELSGGLASLPSMSSMLAANSEQSAQSFSTQAVSGTAPLLKNLSASNVDQYFFGGSLADLTSWAADPNSLNAGQKTAAVNNYRGVDGASGGQGACRMAQETGAVFDRMLSNGTSACYMKKLPAALGKPADTFAQTAADKLVRVHATNMGEGPGEMYVNIKVHGANSMGAGNYKATLYFCAGTSGAPTSENGVETFEFNKSTGIFSTSNGGNQHSSQATAYLKKVGDTIMVDVSKNRSASFAYSESGHSYKAEVTLTGDNKVFNKAYNEGDWGTGKNFSVASFTGASMENLRFLAGAFKGFGTSDNCSGCGNWSYEGGTEFQDTQYVSTTSSALYSELAAVNLATDSFYSAPVISAVDLSEYDCGAAADSTIDMDFESPAVIAVTEVCEGDRLFDNQNAWQMCEGGRESEHIIWQHHHDNN